MIVIMLAGKARVGKTTLANWIAKFAFENQYTPVILPFAKALKDAAAAQGYTKEKNPEAYRKFCQEHGEAKRKEDEDYWVNKFWENIKQIYDEETQDLKTDPNNWHERVVIVDDMRYGNEVKMARKLRALTVFIKHNDRPLEDNSGEWRQHESEQMANIFEADIDGHASQFFEFVLNNDGTLKEYEAKAKKYIPAFIALCREHSIGHLCDCELCSAIREDRMPDPRVVFNEITEELTDDNDD